MKHIMTTLYLSTYLILLTGCLSTIADGAGAVVSATGSVIGTTVKTTYDVVSYPFSDDDEEEDSDSDNDDGYQ